MKKTLAIVLTLALLVTLAAPVFAAEQRSHICPLFLCDDKLR